VKHTEQRGIWVPTQHLLLDQGKPRKTFIDYEDRLLLGYKKVRTSQDTYYFSVTETRQSILWTF
jgi:hypothetical protein